MNPYHDLDKIREATKRVRETCAYQRKQLAKPELVLPRLAVITIFFVASGILKVALDSFSLGVAVAIFGTFVAIIL
jgi:cell division protein FtsL